MELQLVSYEQAKTLKELGLVYNSYEATLFAIDKALEYLSEK